MLKKYFFNYTKRNFSTFSIWIKGGSDMDSNNKKGINKILCELLTRGCEGFENYKLSEYIESYGAEFNHEIFEDGISLSIKSLNEHFHKLLPLVDLILDKPILSEIEFLKVKKSSIDLIKKEKENPFNICYQKWKKLVYKNHPYAFNSIGNLEDVSRITYNDVLSEFENFKTRKKYLISNNLEINAENLKSEDEIDFQDSLSYKNNNLNDKDRFISSFHDSYQTIIMLGNQTCTRKSNDYLALKILESYLSYGMSSVLFRLFRENNGITYDLGVHNPIRCQNTPFFIYLSVSNKKALFAFRLLSSLWNDLLLTQIADNDIFLAKEKLKSSFLIANQSLDDILQRKIQLLSYGIVPVSNLDLNKRTDSVSPIDVFTVFKKYFSKPFLSVAGNKNICDQINQEWNKNF